MLWGFGLRDCGLHREGSCILGFMLGSPNVWETTVAGCKGQGHPSVRMWCLGFRVSLAQGFFEGLGMLGVHAMVDLASPVVRALRSMIDRTLHFAGVCGLMLRNQLQNMREPRNWHRYISTLQM